MRAVWSLLCLLLFLTAAGAPAAQSLSGTWSGMLAFPGQPLLFVITFTNGASGLTATAASPYQGDGAIAVDSISQNGEKLSFAIAKLDVAYSGTIEGPKIDGTFTQHGTTLPLVLTPSSVGTKNLSGTWLGTLTTADGKLLLALNVQPAANGALTATLDSPYQKAFAIPVTSIVASNGVLTFAMSALDASFTGAIGGTAISGTFTQRGQKLPLTFARP